MGNSVLSLSAGQKEMLSKMAKYDFSSAQKEALDKIAKAAMKANSMMGHRSLNLSSMQREKLGGFAREMMGQLEGKAG
jgi:hypothetical protein